MWNPIITEDVFEKVWVDSSNAMTLDWTINKSLLLVTLTILSAVWVWNYALAFLPYIYPIAIVAFVVWLIITFNKKTASYLGFVYAILEWIFIWTISAIFDAQIPWVVIQAVALTFWVFMILLSLYKAKIIQATENFKAWVIASTLAIMVIYLIWFVWNLTWWYSFWFIHEWWIIGIWFSLVVVWIASLNLILDFDSIEEWVKMQAPKYMEWYASFWLLVTLVWLYLEILRLLSKIRWND
jgi:uncharacterized YccA/Bax inhibitor family protein